LVILIQSPSLNRIIFVRSTYISNQVSRERFIVLLHHSVVTWNQAKSRGMADILSTHLKKAKHTKVICADNAVDNVQGDQSVFSVPTVKSNINIRAPYP